MSHEHLHPVAASLGWYICCAKPCNFVLKKTGFAFRYAQQGKQSTREILALAYSDHTHAYAMSWARRSLHFCARRFAHGSPTCLVKRKTRVCRIGVLRLSLRATLSALNFTHQAVKDDELSLPITISNGRPRVPGWFVALLFVAHLCAS